MVRVRYTNYVQCPKNNKKLDQFTLRSLRILQQDLCKVRKHCLKDPNLHGELNFKYEVSNILDSEKWRSLYSMVKVEFFRAYETFHNKICEGLESFWLDSKLFRFLRIVPRFSHIISKKCKVGARQMKINVIAIILTWLNPIQCVF